MDVVSPILVCIASLFGTICITAMNSALRRLRKLRSRDQLNTLTSKFFYMHLQRPFVPQNNFESLFFSIVCTQVVMGLCYAASAITILMDTEILTPSLFGFDGNDQVAKLPTIYSIGLFCLFLLFSVFFADFLPRALGTRDPKATLNWGAPITSIFLTICLPFSIIYLRFTHLFSRSGPSTPHQTPIAQVKEKVIELIQEATVNTHLEPGDKKLIASVVTFKDRIVREVMVPRVDVFSLNVQTSLQDAVELLKQEGFSRTPVYKDSVDNVIGVLMYKDLLTKAIEAARHDPSQERLKESIESLVKPVIFAPETQKISHLLQDFRNRKMHLAVVVDEYGGTEGVVTIEDVIEEIVGEIADEYDQEEEQYAVLADGGWVVDGRMSILDIEEKLGVCIPQEAEYDTVGGYIFHRAGCIPQKDFRISHNHFEIKVLSSTDRIIEQVRIRPNNPQVDNSDSSPLQN